MVEWWIVISLIVAGLLILLATGLPVAFSFLVLNLAGVYVFWGGVTGFHQLIDSVFSSVTMFSLLPVPLFVMLGETLFHSGLAFKAVDIVDKWLGRIPGRLGLVAVGSSTIFSSLSGSSMGTTAMLGRVLTPEMESRGYKYPISIGSCMSGGLAMIIPPSALAVILGAVAKVSVGKILIGGVVPGLLLGLLYALYIVLRSWLQPSIAPGYEVTPVAFKEKIRLTLKYVVPLGGVIFIVVGLIFFGIATPTESAAMGAFATYILAMVFRKFNLGLLKKSISGTLTISVMMFMILTGSLAFSQILAFSGATAGLVEFASSLDVHPMLLILVMQVAVFILGTFMESVAIMMITLPIFLPVVNSLGYDGVWFCLLMLINLEVGMKSPPFGFLLFVMKGVAPVGTTMGQIYRATIPFILIDMFAMGLIMIFPMLALWLPSFMAY
jgi:tripartite ATP-independent transporter DctM subunit